MLINNIMKWFNLCFNIYSLTLPGMVTLLLAWGLWCLTTLSVKKLFLIPNLNLPGATRGHFPLCRHHLPGRRGWCPKDRPTSPSCSLNSSAGVWQPLPCQRIWGLMDAAGTCRVEPSAAGVLRIRQQENCFGRTQELSPSPAFFSSAVGGTKQAEPALPSQQDQDVPPSLSLSQSGWFCWYTDQKDTGSCHGHSALPTKEHWQRQFPLSSSAFKWDGTYIVLGNNKTPHLS